MTTLHRAGNSQLKLEGNTLNNQGEEFLSAHSNAIKFANRSIESQSENRVRPFIAIDEKSEISKQNMIFQSKMGDNLDPIGRVSELSRKSGRKSGQGRIILQGIHQSTATPKERSASKAMANSRLKH